MRSSDASLRSDQRVKKFKEGDLAGVGVMVDSCRVCDNCKAARKPYCIKGMVGTYNARDYQGKLTFGGYSNNIVVDQDTYLRSRQSWIRQP